MDLYNSEGSISNTSLKKHMLKTYTWMFIGVLVTFITAFLVANTPALAIYTEGFMPMIFLFAQLGVVVALVSRLAKMKESTARILFIAYSVLTGFTFAMLGQSYAGIDIATAFIASIAFFGSLVVIGSTTKADLSKIGTLCYAGLFGMIIFSLLSMLFSFAMDTIMYSIIGLVLFVGITAWDVQKAKRLYEANINDEAVLSKLSIYSAFQLYLDFINIFLYILRILGNSRD